MENSQIFAIVSVIMAFGSIITYVIVSIRFSQKRKRLEKRLLGRERFTKHYGDKGWPTETYRQLKPGRYQYSSDRNIPTLTRLPNSVIDDSGSMKPTITQVPLPPMPLMF